MKLITARPVASPLLVLFLAACLPGFAQAADIDYDAIMKGIRPRGYGAGNYTLYAAAPGARTYHVATTGSDANAGTAAAPFRTINKAAQVAAAGDVVIIHDGTYAEAVAIKNAGAAGKPIVFQAANRGGVLLAGGNQYSFQGADFYTGNSKQYVTVKGIVFRDYAQLEPISGDPYPAAVHAASGWLIEDCLFDHAGGTGAVLWGLNIIVRRCTFQYNWIHAMHGWGPSNGATTPTDPKYIGMNAQLVDTVLRGNNVKNAAQDPATSSSVQKFTNAKNVLIDNVESYENNGHGMWFDGSAYGYVVRNSYFHDNQKSGLDFEISWGGLVEQNVFANNANSGLFINNTSGIEVRYNLFYHNETSVEMVDYTRTDAGIQWRLKDITIHDNSFKGWTKVQSGVPAASVYHAISSFNTTPQTQNVSVDYNTYDRQPAPSVSGTQLKPVLGRWLVYGWADTIADMQLKLGWELHGKIATIAWPPLPMVAAPVITPNGGNFSTVVTVTLSCATAGAAIHYTTDGSTPAVASPLYSGPFPVAQSATVKARAVKTGFLDSPISSASFVVVIPNRAPVVTSSATASPNPASAGNAVSLVVAASDPDGDALTYAWDFGDGGSGSGASASHVYSSAGTYIATVTIADGKGATASSSVAIAVTPASSADLVLHWSLDEGSGTVAGDSSGHGMDGAVRPGATWGAGYSGAGIVFDGTGRIDRPNFSIPTTEVTAAFWIKTSDRTRLGTPLSYACAGCDNEFLIYNYTNLALYIGGVSAVTGVSVNDGAWHHIAVTWRSSDGLATLYKDGAAVFAKKVYAKPLVAGGSLIIGQEQDTVGGGFDPKQAFIGSFDDLSFYSRALTSAEVAAMAGRNAALAADSVQTVDEPSPMRVTKFKAQWDGSGGKTGALALELVLPGLASSAEEVHALDLGGIRFEFEPRSRNVHVKKSRSGTIVAISINTASVAAALAEFSLATAATHENVNLNVALHIGAQEFDADFAAIYSARKGRSAISTAAK